MVVVKATRKEIKSEAPQQWGRLSDLLGGSRRSVYAVRMADEERWPSKKD